MMFVVSACRNNCELPWPLKKKRLQIIISLFLSFFNEGAHVARSMLFPVHAACLLHRFPSQFCQACVFLHICVFQGRGGEIRAFVISCCCCSWDCLWMCLIRLVGYQKGKSCGTLSVLSGAPVSVDALCVFCRRGR